MLVATALLLPFALWIDQPWNTELEVNAMIAIIALALGPTALATLIILNIVNRQGASFLSQINFLLPLSGVLLARLFLDETLPRRLSENKLTYCGSDILALFYPPFQPKCRPIEQLLPSIGKKI